MKVVLRQDVPKLGEAGTIQDVSNGYARNYLIPQGMAVVATPGEAKTAEHNLAVKARKLVRQEEQLQSLADRINGQRLEFTARSGEQGRLFGSITGADIAEKLSAAVGEEIDRRKVVLEEPLRTVGDHVVAVHLIGRLRPTVTVAVRGETEDGTIIASPVVETAPAEQPAAEAETTSDGAEA
ncbi:MAG: 50S ribosomal protein L9 [Thermomicrobiales bacterium]|nr:50S ribosomal protein L9 [Thermomicrobiales bacterium]